MVIYQYADDQAVEYLDYSAFQRILESVSPLTNCIVCPGLLLFSTLFVPLCELTSLALSVTHRCVFYPDRQGTRHSTESVRELLVALP